MHVPLLIVHDSTFPTFRNPINSHLQENRKGLEFPKIVNCQFQMKWLLLKEEL